MTPTLLPAPRLDSGIEPLLVERASERMLEPAKRAGYELALLGATVLPQQEVICRTENGTWLLVDHYKDPTRRQYKGRIPIPEAEHSLLTILRDAGVRPDIAWVGHQLPETWTEGDRLDRLVPPPAHLREKDARLVQRLRAGAKLVLQVMGATVAVAGAAAMAPLAALGTIGLDPVILGGVRHPTEPVVEWVLLAQWEWQ